MKHRLKDAGAVAAALAAFAGAAAGCNVLVGVGDYSIADGEAPDTSTPVLDTGAVVDNDAQGDATVDVTSVDAREAEAEAAAEAGPDASADTGNDGVTTIVDASDEGDVLGPAEAGGPGEAGSSDGGGGDAEAGAAPNCAAFVPPAQATFTQLVETCVLAISCDPFVFPVSLSDCISNDVLRATGSYACLSTISDCTGWYNCQGDRFATINECPGFASFCDGNNVAFDCSDGSPGLVTDCTKQGGTCATYTDSNALVHADCVVVPTCTNVDGGVQCSSNNQAIACIGGAGFGLNCTAVDSTCQAEDFVGQSCLPNGTACTTPGTSSCSGATSLSTCTANDQGFTYDCSRAGGSCTTGDGGAGCVAPGCSLASNCTESCDGDHTLSVCVGGAPFTVDCTEYGFTSCGPLNGSGNAFCLP
jgi:hypothetical protein